MKSKVKLMTLIIILFITSFFAVNNSFITQGKFLSQVQNQNMGKIAKPIVEILREDSVLNTNKYFSIEQPFKIKNFDEYKGTSDTAFEYKMNFTVNGLQNLDYEIILYDIDNNLSYNIENDISDIFQIGAGQEITQNYKVVITFRELDSNLNLSNFSLNVHIDATQVNGN